ncbi:ABC transporter permease subunit [Roseburia hominis]
MKAIARREIKNYLKRPLFWLGVVLVIFGVFQQLEPYMRIHYVSSEKEIEELIQEYPEYVPDADISDGYVPTEEKERKEIWESEIWKVLLTEFEMSQPEAEKVLEEIQELDIEDACEYLETKYQYYNTIYAYEDTAFHQGTKEEINSYIKEKLEHKRFSYYFSRKFADFAGLYMGFFATILLAALFWQDTRKNTYELLHTKPVTAGQYVAGKTAGGFLVCLLVLAILNLLFWGALSVMTGGSGFEVKLTDFLAATAMYILPNMLMIVCVHGLISLLFKNPLPAVPLLILYMVYSNMGSRNTEGMFGYYGRWLAIMVRFPGRFFDTTPPPLAMVNQSFLILASLGILVLCTQLWKRRRM